MVPTSLLDPISFPVCTYIQNGITRKQVALVRIVTMIEILSSPPALRVKTAAEANVEGVAAAIIIPGPSSAPANAANGQIIKGIKTRFNTQANPGANGRETARCKLSLIHI